VEGITLVEMSIWIVTVSAELCAWSGCVQKPVVRSSVLSFTVAEADSQNTASDVDETLITSGVDSVTGTSHLSGIQPLSDLHVPSTSSHSSCDVESDCQPTQPADETEHPDTNDELVPFAVCASPQPNDCLNDIWLSSAAVDLGSPLMPRGSSSCTAVGLHERTNMLT